MYSRRRGKRRSLARFRGSVKYRSRQASLGKEEASRLKPVVATQLATNPVRQSLASGRKRVLHDHG